MMCQQHKADARLVNHALKLAKAEGLNKAVNYIKFASPSGAVYDEIASFLHDNDGLNKSEIGDLLSDGDTNKILSEDDIIELRASYVRLLDFTGMTFDGALRY
jgi:hypothetical protein